MRYANAHPIRHLSAEGIEDMGREAAAYRLGMAMHRNSRADGPAGAVDGAKDAREMTVTGVSIENYRAIESLQLPLDPQLTVLHGANGSGKTSILTAITLALAPDLYGRSRRVELDRHDGLAPRVSLGYGDMLESRVEGGREGWGHLDLELAEFVVGAPEGGECAPVHMFYDTSRKVVSSLTERYVGTQVNYEVLFEWFYAKENEELRLQRQHKDFATRDAELSFVRDAICSMLEGASAPHIDMRGDGPPRFSVALEDQGVKRTLSLEQLSGGYQNVLALAADMAWRLAKHQAQLGGNEPGHAIALIDEVELHLHPAWQQRVLEDLMRTFPSVQFVVTTHSPQVLTTVRPEHIVELAFEDGRVVAGGSPGPTYGASAGDVLAGVMGVERRPDNEFTELLRKYRSLIGRDKGETGEALRLRARLDELSCYDPALSEADMEIRHRKLVRKRKG